jgi:hypothetical protein
MSEQQYPIRTYALIDEDNIVKYIKTFSLSDPISYLGNYEGAKQGMAVDMFDNEITVGMKYNSDLNIFVNP